MTEDMQSTRPRSRLNLDGNQNTTFDTGIAQTIQWYLDNEDWWKHIISGEYQNYFAEMYKDRL